MDENNKIHENGERFFLEYFNSDRIFSAVKRTDYLFLTAIQDRAGQRGRPGRAYLADLSAALELPIPTLSKTAERLQDKGLVTWKTDRTAGQTYVKLTSKAVELMDSERRAMRTAYDRVKAEIDEKELEQALATVRKIAVILKESKEA